MKRDETFAWAKQRAEARATTPAPEVVMKRHTAPAAQAGAMTQGVAGLRRCAHPEGARDGG